MSSWREYTTASDSSLMLAHVSEGIDVSLFQSMYDAAFKEMGLDAKCVHFEVPREEFEECIYHLRDCGFKGVGVGIPHKVDAARLAHGFFTVRYSVGVCNALLLGDPIYGRNTEVLGFMRTISHLEPDVALVLGAGRAARSVVVGLFESGWKVKVWNRNATKTRLLNTTFKRYGEIEMPPQPDPTGCSLIVNATSLGHRIGEMPPLLVKNIKAKTTFYDLVFRQVATEFIRTALQRGLPTIDGRELLVEQTAEALEWWLERDVPRAAMRAAAGLKTPVT